jgi:transmembrane sensor
MNTEQENNKQLIQWLEGNLKGEELSAFEASAEFEDYSKIMNTASDISYPTMNENEVFSIIQNKITKNKSEEKRSKVIPLRRWIAGIAAVAILAFAAVSLLSGSVNISSDVGQFVSHSLPDGSEINLNGQSKVSYKSNFDKERTLHLEGEAFFNVKQGKSFVVETDEGTVSVLGTSFNIFSRNDFFIISCKTGKVKVESNKLSVILQQGERIRFENKVSSGKETFETSKMGTWINGETYFSDSELEQVILSLTSVYDAKINLPSKYKSKRFTGSFVHSDFKKALKMVFSPMGISYSLDDKGKVLITSE